MTASLFLCHVSASPNRSAERLKNESQPISWLFLCQDYLRLLEWQSAIGPLAEYIELGEMLDGVAQELRQPFLHLITELGRRYNSVAWWASRLSERNTMVSPLFLYCCYLKIAQESVENAPGTLCVIAESWEVLESLADVGHQKGRRVVWIARCFPGQRQAVLFIRSAKRISEFLGRSLRQPHRDSGTPKTEAGRPRVLLRTWIDESCLGEDGVFHDRYFPGLAHWLQEKGCAVTTIPVLFSPKLSYRAVWRWLGHNQQQFLNPFKYYRLADYLFALRTCWRQLGMLKYAVYLDGLDVRRLFKAEKERGLFDARCLESLLFYQLPRRLAQSGGDADLFIDVFENMIPEKVLNLGFRRYLPATRLVGFQHGALFSLLLCLFVTPGEAAFAPLPDRVVCNGEFFRDILIREGLPSDKAMVGPALRYTHLWDVRRATDADGRLRILVPLPLVLDSAVELLTKVVSALDSMQDVQILLKAHPMSSPQLVLSAAKLRQLPGHFEFIQESMGDLLARCGLVIALGSSTVHEALAAGVPVIVVGRETALDLNPLGWFDDLGRVARSPIEIREDVARLLTLSDDELAQYQQRAAEILHSCFSPVTEQAKHAFVDGLVGMPGSNVGFQEETDKVLVPAPR